MSTNWPASVDAFGTAADFDTTVLAADPNNLRAAVDALEKWALGPPFFNVKDYGALGNGVQDDTPYIQAALDAAHAVGGGKVVGPAGIYMVSLFPHPLDSAYATALLVYSDTQLVGAGRDATIIRLIGSQTSTAANNYLLLNYNISAGGDQQITVGDITFDGNAGSQTKTCIGVGYMRARGCRHTRVRVLNCYSTYPTSGIETFHFDYGLSTDGSWTDCEVVSTSANTASGFSANSSNNLKWAGCVAYGMGGGAGFTHNGCANLQHVNCHSYLNGNAGFNSEVSTEVTYSGCIAGGDSNGVATYPYAANTFLGNTGAGFTINGSDAQLSGCVSRHNLGYGVWVANSGVAILNGCDASFGTAAGVNVDATSTAWINGGRYASNNGNGIVGPAAGSKLFVGGPIIGGGNASPDFALAGVTHGPFQGPQTATVPAVPASTTAYTHSFPMGMDVYITAGASTCAVALDGTATSTLAASGTGHYRVRVGGSITLTYSSAPTWVWVSTLD